ncbi:hypothetical protein F5Y15DRAFT_121052 [Xylariaceae sp. FL0016]|nr:hypothetical protein F5Y15DRAFT_121052 [Xylariaceae sp. FL0016]
MSSQQGHSDEIPAQKQQQSWKSEPYHPFPPPEDTAEYVSKALPLPPRASSVSSSVYSDDSCAGIFDENVFAQVQVPRLDTILSQDTRQREIVSPQPRYPDHRVLSVNTDDGFLVSPIKTPGSGNESWRTHIVSPMEQTGSRYSLETSLSEPDRLSHVNYSESRGQAATQPEKRHSSDWTSAASQSTKSSDSSCSVHKIEAREGQKSAFRYSDQGSPVGGTSLDIRGLGEPGPDVGRGAGYFGDFLPINVNSRGVAKSHTFWRRSPGREKRAATTTGQKVAFAVPLIDSFSSNRPSTSHASHHRPAPPPLKLSERPVQSDYVKTPFPDQIDDDSSRKSVFDHDDDDTIMRKHKRVSSLGSFGKALRPSSSYKNEAGSPARPEPRHTESVGRPSPVPKVRNMLSKAKHGLGHGLGLSNEEVKKEKRREDLKRQIRMSGAGE